jgi:hypothetical protein
MEWTTSPTRKTSNGCTRAPLRCEGCGLRHPGVGSVATLAKRVVGFGRGPTFARQEQAGLASESQGAQEGRRRASQAWDSQE